MSWWQWALMAWPVLAILIALPIARGIREMGDG